MTKSEMELLVLKLLAELAEIKTAIINLNKKLVQGNDPVNEAIESKREVR